MYKKKGLPETGDIVICTVKKILYHSVFVSLDEFENAEGMIHISEVSPGRIRNLSDYVKVGKRIVCKILTKDKIKGHIDLSLRRVSTSVMRNKLNEYKSEEKAEKLLEKVAKELEIPLEELHKKFGIPVIEKYGTIYPFFQQVSIEGESLLKELNLGEKITKTLLKTIQEKVKIPEAKISSEITLKSEKENGIEIIKKIIKKTEDFSKNKKYKVHISYVSAPKYKIEVKAGDFKKAEEIIQDVAQNLIKEIEQEKGIGEFERERNTKV